MKSYTKYRVQLVSVFASSCYCSYYYIIIIIYHYYLLLLWDCWHFYVYSRPPIFCITMFPCSTYRVVSADLVCCVGWSSVSCRSWKHGFAVSHGEYRANLMRLNQYSFIVFHWSRGIKLDVTYDTKSCYMETRQACRVRCAQSPAWKHSIYLTLYSHYRYWCVHNHTQPVEICHWQSEWN